MSAPKHNILSYLYGSDQVLVEDYMVGQQDKLAIVETMLLPIRLRSGINLIMIYGPLGVGKSYYAIKASYEVLRRIGYINNMSYSEGLKYVIDNYMVFTWEEFKERISRASWKSKLPVIIWDDAGVYGHSYDFFLDKQKSKEISRLFQVIRTRAYNVILTAPSRKLILAAIREMPDAILILLHRKTLWESEARAYIGFMTPSGRIRPKLLFIDYFNKKVPDDVHEHYMNIRDSYNDVIMMDISLEKRDKQVIKTLCRDPDKYFTSEEISRETGISIATLQKVVYPKLRRMRIIETRKKRGVKLTGFGTGFCS